MFGGEERVNNIGKMFNKMFEDNVRINDISDDMDNNKLMIFGITKYHSKLIIELCIRVEISKYLESMFNGKRLSHIIGYESALAIKHSHETYLIILNLMQFLNRKHENILYITTEGNDADKIENSRTCQVYRITKSHLKGIQQNDMDKIVDKYFDH